MRWFIIFCLAFSLNACSDWIQPVEVLHVGGLSGISISREGLAGSVELDVYNPNSMAMQVEDVDIAVLIDGIRVGRVLLPRPQELPKMSEARLEFTIEADTKALLKLIEANFLKVLKGNELELTLDGQATGSAWGMRVDIPVSASEKINLQL